MKKVNKQCILDTPCTVRVSEKNWQVIVQTKYQIAPSKAVVGVDRPIKAPSMHIQTPYFGKMSKFSLLSICQKLFFSKPNSFMHMFNVSTLYRQSIKLLHQKLW